MGCAVPCSAMQCPRRRAMRPARAGWLASNGTVEWRDRQAPGTSAPTACRHCKAALVCMHSPIRGRHLGAPLMGHSGLGGVAEAVDGV